MDFWTYTYINCIRTMPYLKQWYSKYQVDGLVILGVHSPEFEFEKDLHNVVNATQDYSISWPVAQDNNFITGRNYSNRFWPAKYLLDKDGVVRYTHFGEGKYGETEEKIRELLVEAGADFSQDTSALPEDPTIDPTYLTGTPKLPGNCMRDMSEDTPTSSTAEAATFFSKNTTMK